MHLPPGAETRAFPRPPGDLRRQRGYELYAAPLPEGELLVAALALADPEGPGRRAPGRRSTRWIGASEPLLRESARRRHTAHRAGGPRARHPPGTGRVRARGRPLGRRRPRHRSADRGRPGARPGDRRAAGCRRAVLFGQAADGVGGHDGERWLAAFDQRAAAPGARAHGLAYARAGLRGWPPGRARQLTLYGRCAPSPAVMRTLLGVAGGIDFQPPVLATMMASTAASSATALPPSSATDQNATLSQRARSL